MRIAIMTVALSLLAGCGGEGGLRITVETQDLEAGTDIDQLRVHLVAARSPDTSADAEVCRPIERWLPEEGEDLSFPITIVVHPGEETWSCVAVRVRGMLEGDEVLRIEDFFCPNLDGVYDEMIWLAAACHADLGEPGCEPGQICQLDDAGRAECAGSPAGAIFEAEPSTGTWCDGAAE